jgi:hypothetical protein
VKLGSQRTNFSLGNAQGLARRGKLPERKSGEKKPAHCAGFQGLEVNVFCVAEKYRRGAISGGKSQSLLNDLDPLLQGLHPVLKLAVRKLDEGSRLKGFMLNFRIEVPDLLAKGLQPLA